MKIEHIAIFKNSFTRYEVIHHFRESLSKALEKLGVKTTLIDVTTIKKDQLLNLLYRAPPDCTLSMSGLDPLQNGEFLSDQIELPHICWLVDSAHYFQDMTSSTYNILISPDQISSKLLKSWGAAHSYFLPHAFEAGLLTASGGERPYPITFLGSLIDYLEIEECWKRDFPKRIYDSLMEAVERTFNEEALPYQQAFDECVAPHLAGMDLSITHALTISLDRYVRGKDRIQLLKGLEGLSVHIFGTALSKRNWNDFLNLKHPYVLHDAVDFPQAIEIMKKTQILLNSSPMFKMGGHERIFYGLGLGAAVLTTRTPWVQTHFGENEILSYAPNVWNEIGEHIKNALKNPAELQALASRGQAKVLQKHTWDMRAKELLEITEKAIEEINQ